jgi:hypothetical protein
MPTDALDGQRHEPTVGVADSPMVTGVCNPMYTQPKILGCQRIERLHNLLQDDGFPGKNRPLEFGSRSPTNSYFFLDLISKRCQLAALHTGTGETELAEWPANHFLVGIADRSREGATTAYGIAGGIATRASRQRTHTRLTKRPYFESWMAHSGSEGANQREKAESSGVRQGRKQPSYDLDSDGTVLRVTILGMSTTNFLDRMLDPVTASMSRELAETLVALKADDELQSRIEVLRSKANEGTLSSEEDAEYKDFVEALDVISILQSKARQVLVRQAS